MDPEEQMFGIPRLREVLAGHHDAPLDHLQRTVLESVQTFARGAKQADDVTLLLVRYGAAVLPTS
jgi:serine phosphatase RsbU (regulator of sigma subunit)